jgi:hypothetical protein
MLNIISSLFSNIYNNTTSKKIKNTLPTKILCYSVPDCDICNLKLGDGLEDYRLQTLSDFTSTHYNEHFS